MLFAGERRGGGRADCLFRSLFFGSFVVGAVGVMVVAVAGVGVLTGSGANETTVLTRVLMNYETSPRGFSLVYRLLRGGP